LKKTENTWSQRTLGQWRAETCNFVQMETLSLTHTKWFFPAHLQKRIIKSVAFQVQLERRFSLYSTY